MIEHEPKEPSPLVSENPESYTPRRVSLPNIFTGAMIVLIVGGGIFELKPSQFVNADSAHTETTAVSSSVAIQTRSSVIESFPLPTSIFHPTSSYNPGTSSSVIDYGSSTSTGEHSSDLHTTSTTHQTTSTSGVHSTTETHSSTQIATDGTTSSEPSSSNETTPTHSASSTTPASSTDSPAAVLSAIQSADTPRSQFPTSSSISRSITLPLSDLTSARPPSVFTTTDKATSSAHSIVINVRREALQRPIILPTRLPATGEGGTNSK